MCSNFYAYGLHLQSDVPISLDGHGPENTEDTVRVSEGSVEFPAGADGEVTRRDGSVYLRVDDIGTFRIGECSVTVDRTAGTTDTALSAAILGRVLAILLYRRGYFVMHGSAAVVDGGGVAFVGHKTSGKSSLTAGLYANGHRVVTDDILVVDPDDWSLVPSFPRLKLTGRTLEALELADDVRRPERKRWYPVEDRFGRDPVPLDAVFELVTDGTLDQPTLDSLDSAAAMETLLKHSASAELVEATATEARHFRECAGVADVARVKRLARPRDGRTFRDLVRAVENDVD